MDEQYVWKREEPGKYWNFEELKKVPAYREAGFADSQAEGLQDILYDGAPVNGKMQQVFAYIGMPSGPVPEGGFPGIVLIHGGGGTAFPEYVRLWISYGYAVIAIDWYNRRPVFKDHQENSEPEGRADLPGEMHRDHVACVANMVLAHSLLRSLPQVNPDRTGFVGLSWGSLYGAIVAAIDDRFKFYVEIYCGNCRKNKNELKSPEQDFVDGRFLHAAKAPVYWIASTNDQNMTPEQWQCGWNECPKAWNKTMVINLPHAHVGFTFPACRRIADAFLQGGTPLPFLIHTKFENGVISALIRGDGKGICNAVLCYTCDGDEPVTFKRKWHKLPAVISGNEIKAKVPAGAIQFFLSAYDEESPFDDCCGSSDLIVLKP